jgi:hypothetical protein
MAGKVTWIVVLTAIWSGMQPSEPRRCQAP